MELRTLRYLVAVADTGSVTAAARRVRIAQPSLSRQLRQLETELGLALFDRGGGRLALTSAGEAFVPIARDLLARADNATAAASTLAAGRLDRVTIAAPPTTMTDIIAPFLATLDRDDPFPAVIEHEPGSVYDTLRRGADLAISTEPPPARYADRMLAVLPVWLYVPAGHRWAARQSVRLDELAEQTLLVLPPGFKPRQVLDRAAESSGVRLADLIETGSPEVAQALTAAGRGLAVVSDDSRFALHGLRIDAPGRAAAAAEAGPRTPPGSLVLELHAGWDREHHAAAAIAELAVRISRFCIARYGRSAAPPEGRPIRY